MSGAPLIFSWQGDGFTPLPTFARESARRFIIGQKYKMEVVEDRSEKSHSHYFAALHDAWLNVPESQRERFPTETHLRKWALIQAGFRDERTFVARSKSEAVRLAAFIKPLNDYAVIVASECVVTVMTAKSQSRAAMGNKDFQASKTAVLEVVARLIGVAPETLKANAGIAA